MTTEARPELITVAELGEVIKAEQAWHAEHPLEGPLPQSAAKDMINQFLSNIGFPNTNKFDITNNGVRVIYEEIGEDKEKKRPGVNRLAVFAGTENATAAVDSNGKESLGWAHHGTTLIYHEDNLYAETRMKSLLSRFLPQKQPSA